MERHRYGSAAWVRSRAKLVSLGLGQTWQQVRILPDPLNSLLVSTDVKT